MESRVSHLISGILISVVVALAGWNLHETKELAIQQAITNTKLESLVTRGEIDALESRVLVIEHQLEKR